MKYFILALAISCGGESGTDYRKEPPPSTTPPTSGDTTYSEVKPILQESCGGASCHANASFLQNESALRGNAQVRKRIASDSMPPAFANNYYLWEDGTRKMLVLNFLAN